MYECRSSILKMMLDRAEKDRRIERFPTPFSRRFTPYHQTDFSRAVREACLSSKCPLTGLKISKAIFLGDVAVGKTSLVNRYCHQVFDCNYKATIGVDFEVERFDILKVPFNFQIWDTAGQERFKCIAASYYRGAHGMVAQHMASRTIIISMFDYQVTRYSVVAVLFDISNLHSLSHCAQWLEDALSCNTIRPLVFLIGTKRDLISNASYQYVELQATRLAQQLGAEFWAVSSRTGDGVNELFSRMAALAFDSSVQNDLNSASNTIKLGADLSYSKKSATKPYKKCTGNNCIQSM